MIGLLRKMYTILLNTYKEGRTNKHAVHFPIETTNVCYNELQSKNNWSHPLQLRNLQYLYKWEICNLTTVQSEKRIVKSSIHSFILLKSWLKNIIETKSWEYNETGRMINCIVTSCHNSSIFKIIVFENFSQSFWN